MRWKSGMSNVIVRVSLLFGEDRRSRRQWLGVILQDKARDNRERVASFAAESGCAYNAGHSEAINAHKSRLR